MVIAFIYQFIDNSWWLNQTIGLVSTGVLFIFSVLYICESPKFYYLKGRFEESKLALKHIAYFNGYTDKTFTCNFKFDKEIILETAAADAMTN